MKKKIKVMSYYTYENKIGGPRTYIQTLEESDLSKKYDFCSCYQNEAPGGLSISLLVRMIKRIKELNPDIVHVHGAQSEGFYGVVAAHLAGCHNIVLTIHGFAHDDSSCKGIKRMLYKYFIEPTTLLLSTRIYTVCNYAAQRHIVKFFGGKRCVGCIHNPAPDISPKIPRPNLRNKLNIDRDTVVLCIVSRITKDKGFHIIEKIVKKLNENGWGNFILLIIGGGQYELELRKQLQKEEEKHQVIFIGETNDVASYLNASDIFIFPSLHENLSIALLEAAQAGLACICSDVGGNSEIIENNVSGYLINDVNNIEKYVNKIILLMNDKILRLSLGAKAKETVSNNFSISDIIRKIDVLYDDVSA